MLERIFLSPSRHQKKSRRDPLVLARQAHDMIDNNSTQTKEFDRTCRRLFKQPPRHAWSWWNTPTVQIYEKVINEMAEKNKKSSAGQRKKHRWVENEDEVSSSSPHCVEQSDHNQPPTEGGGGSATGGGGGGEATTTEVANPAATNASWTMGAVDPSNQLEDSVIGQGS
jgi:hypothetical protein